MKFLNKTTDNRQYFTYDKVIIDFINYKNSEDFLESVDKMLGQYKENKVLGKKACNGLTRFYDGIKTAEDSILKSTLSAVGKTEVIWTLCQGLLKIHETLKSVKRPTPTEKKLLNNVKRQFIELSVRHCRDELSNDENILRTFKLEIINALQKSFKNSSKQRAMKDSFIDLINEKTPETKLQRT